MSVFKKFFGKAEKENSKNEISDTPSIAKTDINNFEDIVVQNAGLSFEKQEKFNEITGGLAWNIDLNTATLSFGNLDFQIEIIGSLSFNDYSWMWGWANSQSGFPESLLSSSLKLKAMGEEKQIQEFTKGHFETEEGFEHKMGLVCSGLLNADAYFCANYGQGTMVLVIKSDQIPKIDDSNLGKVLTTFPKVISGLALDHKAAFTNYLIDRKCEIKTTDHVVKGTRNGKVVTAEFDELSRMINLSGEL